MPDVVVEPLWRGETVACLATGPSLTAEDCEYLRGKVRIIAINDAYRLAPFAECLYSSDRMWWAFHKGVPSFTGMKYGIGKDIGKNNRFHEHPDIRVLYNTGVVGLEESPTGLRHGSNSGYAAIGLAYHLGAARIILLGYDLSWDRGKQHFFGSHPPGFDQIEALFPIFLRNFETLVAALAERGVEVVNCTRRTALTAFRQASLEEVLPYGAVA